MRKKEISPKIIMMIVYVLAILLNHYILSLYINYFPGTGYGRIINFPIITILNLALVFVAFKITKRSRDITIKVIVWIFTILAFFVVPLLLFPQEADRPSAVHILFERLLN